MWNLYVYYLCIPFVGFVLNFLKYAVIFSNDAFGRSIRLRIPGISHHELCTLRHRSPGGPVERGLHESEVPITIETVSPEGTFCDTVQIPSSVGDMELI